MVQTECYVLHRKLRRESKQNDNVQPNNQIGNSNCNSGKTLDTSLQLYLIRNHNRKLAILQYFKFGVKELWKDS